MKHKRIITCLLTLLGCMAANALDFEVDGIKYTTTTDGVRVSGYNKEYEGDIVLNGTVTYNDVTYACTRIGAYAFKDCSSLTAIGDLSACTSIGNYAFQNCSSLTAIGDLSACTSIEDYAFYSCSSLTAVGDLSACTSIGGGAFYYCSSLTTVGDLSACTSIGGSAFRGCSSLTAIGDLSACTSIGSYAFSGIEKVYFSQTTVPTLTAVPSDAGTTFFVSEEALEAFCSAEYWSDIKYQILPRVDDESVYSYDVNAPVLDGVGANNLTKVMSLKVTGDISSEDIMFIRNNMVNLHHLDLTDANYVASNAEYATGKKTADNSVGGLYRLLRLRSVKLPRSAKTIENDALRNCSYLSEIIIPEGIERIENGSSDAGALTGCSFNSITLPNSLTYIGYNAFHDCSKLTSIVLPESLTEIGAKAFANCSRLSSVTFSPKLEKIGENAFYCCNLTEVKLPTSLKTIGYHAFYKNSYLTELRIPSSVESIGSEAFYGCSNLRDVYTYVVDPITINTNTFSTYTAATLHIPEQCENTYFRHPQWGQFLTKVSFNEPYTYFYATNDVVLGEGERFDAEEGSDITFDGNAGSSLTIEGEGDQELGDMNIIDNGTMSGSVIADENLKAKTITFHLPVTAAKWRFFAFPFRVKLSNVVAPGTYVFRRYDGAVRALSGATGWAALEEGTEWLEPGVGYIFQCTKSGTLKITVEQPDFYWHGNLKNTVLTAHLTGNGVSNEHASWNFVGNPMTNYYDIDDMHYDAPLTIWDGSKYVAYRPGDDNYQLRPFEAFFLQKPEGHDGPQYDKDCRMGYNAAQKAHAAKARRTQRVNSGRQLLNLVLSYGKDEDRTRVVFNQQYTSAYELECDAAKLISTEQVPQLYTVDQQVRYAINERQQGTVQLAYVAPTAGSYTISAPRMDKTMLLKDLTMGTTFDLRNGEYTFDTEAGTFEGRFVLVAPGETNAIENAETLNTESAPAYTLDGKLLPEGQKGQKGIVVVKGKKMNK